MKLLADANIERAMVLWLRSGGHDVVWGRDFPPAHPDSSLMDAAREDGRIVLTYDLDFGEIVFIRHLKTPGVILLRFEAGTWRERLSLLQFHWPDILEYLPGNFVVVTDVKVRARPLP